MQVKSFINQTLFHSLLFSLFLCSCSSVLYPKQVRTGPVPEDFFGVVHAGHTLKHEEYVLLNEMNAKWTLRTINWHSIEKEKGVFNFSGYDSYVDSVKKIGMKTIVVLAYQTPWLYPEGENKRYISPENIPYFLNYVEEMVQHFRGRIDVWDIWNEPNFNKFWKGSDKDFYELSRRTAQKIREVDPEAYIIGGAYSRVPSRFIKKMFRAGGMENLDGIAFHPYALNPAGSMRLTDKFFRIMSDIHFTGDIWITEIGHPNGGWYPHKVSLEGLPSHVVKSMTGAATRNIKALLWYQLLDSYNKDEVPPEKMKDSEKFFGLVYPDFSRKNGANAYALCAKFLPGSRYVPDYVQREKIPSSIASYCFLDGQSGNHTLVLWNDRKRPKKVNLSLNAPSVLYDITTGKGKPLTKEAALEIGRQPVIVTWLGTAVPRLTTIK